MKLLIASDIHGSAKATRQILSIADDVKADKIVLLGDIYNHGPRNALPEEYAPLTVADLLNQNLDRITVIKGNCDSEVDKMISNFDFLDTCAVFAGDKTLILTHGHVYDKDNPPKTAFDALIYGHFHTGFIEKQDGKVFINVGSVALPKNNTPKSLLIADDTTLSLIDLDQNLIDRVEL